VSDQRAQQIRTDRVKVILRSMGASDALTSDDDDLIAEHLARNIPVHTTAFMIQDRRRDDHRIIPLDVLESIPKRPQTQRALDDQLRELNAVAVRLGLYDAADFIQGGLARRT
jgi:hypothetical protein